MRNPSVVATALIGFDNVAEVAADPSPVEPAVPVPATVDIIPAVVTRRTLLLVESAM
jgi:hypothetical protein